MGIEAEQEIVQMIGVEERIMARISASIEECHKHEIFTSHQALQYIGNKIRTPRGWQSKKSKIDDAKDFILGTVLAHVLVI